ncbi:hypothetical protein Q9L58_008225 [Maublancomyces gigas]|uniref:RING-type domain-containing protein n=1 Tax=Discina gigas TaxID=1032678 RepID=A0ABR3GAI8_9PEZI
MAQTTPIATCTHKACSECSTAWNVCCDCLFSDMMHSRNRIIGGPKQRPGFDYPRVLSVTPSHPALPITGHGANSGVLLSRSAKRRNRRQIELSISSNLATCRVPLPEDHRPDGGTRDTREAIGDIHATSFTVSTGSAADDGEPVEAVSATSPVGGYFSATRFTVNIPALVVACPPARLLGSVLQVGGDFSSNSFRQLARPPAAERVRVPPRLPGEVIESSVDASRVSLELSPTEQEERPKRTPNARARLGYGPRGGGRGAALVPRPRNVWNGDDSRYQHNWSVYYVPQRPTVPQSGRAADVSSLEDTWAPVAPYHDSTANIDSWDPDVVLLATVPDRSDIGDTARYASRLLEAFSHGATPPVPGAFTTTQQRLLSAALTSILAIMPDRCVDAAAQSDPFPSSVNTATTTEPLPSMVDTAAETDPLPPSVDLTMRPDATCVVCFTRMANTVLAPCWHLVLCAVCICFQDIIISRVLLMRGIVRSVVQRLGLELGPPRCSVRYVDGLYGRR